MKRPAIQPTSGFTLVEMLVVIGIMAILIAVSLPIYSAAILSGRASASMSNLRELAQANIIYTGDHNGFYCPAQDVSNNYRWHGSRTSSSSAWDPSKGYLAPYLGQTGSVKVCPIFADLITSTPSFVETGAGGYGYNETYIGGTPANWLQPANTLNVPRPSRTVMFTTTAFSVASGLQEYPFSEAYQWVDPNGNLDGGMQPSVHFRAHGRALVAWCDGHVTAELPTQLGGTDFYGGNSAKADIGWFGPSANNGYWNPAYNGP